MQNTHRRFHRFAFISCLLLSFSGCGEFRPIWREQKLPSGQTIKVTAFQLVWGTEHDDRNFDADCFAMEFVTNKPDASDASREQEAKDVFELARPVSEHWGFKTATLSGFPTLERKGKFDFFIFSRGEDGAWSCKHEKRKVFAND